MTELARLSNFLDADDVVIELQLLGSGQVAPQAADVGAYGVEEQRAPHVRLRLCGGECGRVGAGTAVPLEHPRAT